MLQTRTERLESAYLRLIRGHTIRSYLHTKFGLDTGMPAVLCGIWAGSTIYIRQVQCNALARLHRLRAWQCPAPGRGWGLHCPWLSVVRAACVQNKACGWGVGEGEGGGRRTKQQTSDAAIPKLMMDDAGLTPLSLRALSCWRWASRAQSISLIVRSSFLSTSGRRTRHELPPREATVHQHT